MRDQDKRKLAEIEQHLVEEDPKLAATLATSKPPASPTAMFIARMLATYMAGLAAIVAGVSASFDILIVVGAVITATVPIEVGYRSWRHRSRSRQPIPPLAATDADTID